MSTMSHRCSTWREIGFALRGNVANGLEYNAGISTTPDASLYTNASAGFREMRANASRVTANEFGYYAGLNYRGVPGLVVGGSVWLTHSVPPDTRVTLSSQEQRMTPINGEDRP